MKKSDTKPTAAKPSSIKPKPKTENGDPVHGGLEKTFQILIENKEFAFQFMEMLPIPSEVFAPDGSSIFVNKAMLQFCGVPAAKFIVGEYNVLKDPVMEQMGLMGVIQKAFHGEAIVGYDIDVPTQDLVNRGLIEEKPHEKAFADWYLYPIMNGKKVAYVVFICVVKKLYHGRPDLARAKEYMDTHWKEDYNAEAVAKSVNMSVKQLYNIFNKYVGMTPGDYYRNCKVERLKDKLQDANLSIKEAFAACGINNHESFFRVFKKITSLTPKQYRNS